MRTIFFILGSALVSSALAGCSGSVDSTPCPSCTGGAGGDFATTTGTGIGPGTGGASSTSSSTSVSTGTGTGTVCGGKIGKPCLDTEYCDFATNQCGTFDDTGVCKPRPSTCPDLYSPTCGCDGKVHGNPCEAAGAGFDLNDTGSCPAPPGKFSCGSTFCDVGTSYCRRSTSDIGGEPSSYSCEQLPPACGNPATCACLASVPCGSMCAAASGGGFVVTCPGG